MDSVKFIEDKNYTKFKAVNDVYEYGVEIADGKYIFVEGEDRYLSTIFEKKTMTSEEFCTKEEAMLWLLDFDLWKYIYRGETV